MFHKEHFCHISSTNRGCPQYSIYVYKTTDSVETMLTEGYFNEALLDLQKNDVIAAAIISETDNTEYERVYFRVTQRTLDTVAVQETHSALIDEVESNLQSQITTNANNIAKLQTNKADKTTDFETPITASNKGATMKEIEEVQTTSIKFKGYVSTTQPASDAYLLVEGNMWINAATMPSSFPVPASSIRVWDGSAWQTTTETYTPDALDAWSNINNNEGYYWFGAWKVFSTDLSTEYFTLNQTSGLWEIKQSIHLPGTPTVDTPDGTTPQAIVNVDYVNTRGTIDNKITNCVLQIPQDIKLELSTDGTLTLKAGSKVYVPNGTGTFNAINIESDVSVSSVQGGASGEITIYYNPNNNRLNTYSSSADSSGTSDPSSGVYTFYNTADNLIKRIEDDSIAYSGLSFPIAHVTANSGTITSLDEVFNGCGYIGFVVFTFPGMQYAIPNGRSSDGTLNNDTTIQTVVRTATVTSTSRTELYASYLGLAAVAPGIYTYSYVDNMLMASDGSTRNYIFFGTLSMSSTQITGMNPKYPMRVTDYWDFNKLVKKVDNAINDLESSKQDNLTQEQLNAVNSGITANKLAELERGKAGIPDYSASVSVQKGLPYTVQKRGYYYVVIDKNDYNTVQIITVNGQKVAETVRNFQLSIASAFVPCEVGDIIDISGMSDMVSARVDSYCPIKGA